MKERAPLTVERATLRIESILGWTRMAEIAGTAERTVRNWSDPDTTATIPFDVAIKFDAEYRAAGGDGAPLFQVYALRLEADTTEACADSRRLAELTASAAKEGGEAIAALIVAAQPGATPQLKARAELEAEEAIGALTATLAQFRAGGRGVGNVESPGGRTTKMPRILRHSIACPHCEQQLRVRTSRMVVPTLKDVSFQCVNMDCSATFGGRIELLHGIAPSLNPKAGVDLRMAPQRQRQADNDNLGTQIIRAPEVAPPLAANDADDLSEAI